MSDPKRLLDGATGFEAWVLLSAPDDPPPSDLLARTVDAVVAATPAAAVFATAGATASAVKATGVMAASSGLFGAAAIGAIAGVVVVGGFEYTATLRAPPPHVGSSAARLPTSAAPVAALAVEPTSFAPTATKSVERPAAPVSPASAPRSTTRHASSLAGELALLDQAKAALRRRDPSRALALLARYSHEFPGGQLADDAALLRADAEAARAAGTMNP
jgi:hypothetical protein